MKKMINALLTASMLTSFTVVPFVANAVAISLPLKQENERSYEDAKITDIDAIEQKVKDFVNEKGYNATVSAFKENVLISFKQQPIGENMYDTTAIKQEIRTFCENNSVDPSLVQVIFLLNDAAKRVVITDIDVIEQKVKDFVKEKGYNATVSAFKENVLISFKQQAIGEKEYDTTAIKQEIRTFCENNSVDPSLVQVIFLVNDATKRVVITDINIIEQKVKDFVNEKGYNATVSAFKENVLISFKQQAIGEKEYDTTAIKQEIRTFCENNSVDSSLVQVIFLVNDVAEKVKGDVNCDGQVDMSDAVMIMQALANPDKYGLNGTAENHLTEQGKLNGDMDGDGLTVGDALAIQKLLLDLSAEDE